MTTLLTAFLIAAAILTFVCLVAEAWQWLYDDRPCSARMIEMEPPDER